MEEMKRESFASVNIFADIERGNGFTIATKWRVQCWGISAESDIGLMDALQELDRKFSQQAQNYERSLEKNNPYPNPR